MAPNPPTSDSEKDKIIPGSFIKLLTTTAERNHFVVCAYEDGAVQKFTSAQISTKYFRPRFSQLESYYGIEELQQGLQVRCFWNIRFPHSKASIIGVGSAVVMDKLYEKATFDSGREDHTAPPKAAVKKQKKIERYATSFAQLQADCLAQRAALVNQHLSESQNLSFDSIPNTENSNDSVFTASNHPETPPPHGSQMPQDLNTSIAASASTLTSGIQSDDNDTLNNEFLVEDETPEEMISSKENFEKIVKKRKQYEQKLAKYQELEKGHSEYVVPPKRKKLDVNTVPFSFLRSEEDDKTGYKQLIKDSDIWVNNTILTSFTKTAKSLKVYAAKIMWNVLLTCDDIMTMDRLKKKSVGFVKQFGHKNLEDVYHHICKVRETKEKSSSTGKWGIEKLKSMDDYKDIWRKYFPHRVDLEKSYANKKTKKKAN